MTRYFMKFTPLFAAEVQLMTPPRHQPRRSGRIRSSFRYSADDVRCKDCTRYDSGHPCHLNECVCLEERIEAGVVELNTLARECFGGRMFRPLQRRLRDELNRQPFRFFLGDAHRERWTHWKNRCYGMSERNAAALFLLTADEGLWQRVLWHFDSSGFDFPAIRLSGIHPELYSILLALVICFGITPLFNQSISQRSEIVRVTKDIHAGELITKDMVATAEVGSYNLPSGLMTAKDNVVGKYAKADLAVGDYILAAKLSDAPAAENAYLYNLDGTKQAISVTIKSFATGLSGKLQSGDIVSVIVADYPEDGETTIPAELQYVEIISVTASTGYDANTGEAKGDEKELPSTVTFLVLPEQAKVLAELEQVAKLHLALVYRGTADGAKQFIEAQDALVEELYAEPEEDPIEEGEAADPTAEMPESEVTG